MIWTLPESRATLMYDGPRDDGRVAPQISERPDPMGVMLALSVARRSAR